MLVVYDNTGFIYFSGTGLPEPEGIPFLNVEVPDGMYLKSINTSVTPHEPVFEKYPKSEIEILKEENSQQQADLDYLLLMME